MGKEKEKEIMDLIDCPKLNGKVEAKVCYNEETKAGCPNRNDCIAYKVYKREHKEE